MNMLKIIEKNSLFFALYFISFFWVFFSILNKPMLEVTLYFSAHRTVFGDYFFSYCTLLGEAYPYFLIALFFYFYKKNKENVLKIAITGLAMLLVPFLLKEIFVSPRPFTILEEMGELDTFNYVKGIELNRGATSFPSGHTASAFALWGLLAFQFPSYKSVQIALFLVAFLVGVSRVYLAQHFPQDALFGSAVGLSVALGVEYFFSKKTALTVQAPPQ